MVVFGSGVREPLSCLLTPPRIPIARTPRSDMSITLTPYFCPSSCILSINDFVAFVFGFFMLPYFPPLPVIPEVSRSSTGSWRNLWPACEHWHLASALTVSVPVQQGRSSGGLADQFFFLHAVPVPSRFLLDPSGVLSRTRRPLPEFGTSASLLVASCRLLAAGKRDQLPMTGTLQKL